MSEPESAAIRWLHLTDLHVGKDNESQRTALRALVASVHEVAGDKPCDLVILTGDLAFSGRSDEYKTLESEVIGPLRRIPSCTHAAFVAVPGNHDIDCDIGLPPAWKEIGKPRQEKFFNLDKEGMRVRASRAAAFSEYQAFVLRNDIHSVDPTKAPAALIALPDIQPPLAIVSLVTAFFSDKDVADWRKAPAPVHPLRALLQTLPESQQVLVLGHHPGGWFTPESEGPLHSLLVEQNALYLHGHEHRVSSKFGAHGLVSLGFGAAYVAPSESPPVPYYRNSYAICELEASLHIAVISWDAENGQWRPDRSLPGDFCDRSDRLSNGYVLSLPSTRLASRARPYATLASAIRKEFRIDRSIWLANDSPKRWAQLLTTIGALRDVKDVYTLPTQTLPAGHVEFRVSDGQGQFLIYAISGHGDVLNFEQVQSINTELDRQDYDGCIVATLGELSGEAKTLAAQLSTRKSIIIRQREDIVVNALRTIPAGLERAIREADSNTCTGTLIFTASGFGLLLRERTSDSWFRVYGEDGAVLPESAELVLEVRRQELSLRYVRYDGPGQRQAALPLSSAARPPFDREEYRRKTRAYFNDVKYAPLAALGLRFRQTSLTEIYVEASADVGGVTKASTSLTRVLTEFLDTLNLPQSQREQLESQMRSRYGLNRSAEVGAARKLYQRYNNIVVLGDPGSGKTCFLKHEILTYCDPPAAQETWYSLHLPVYISLAEAARLVDGSITLIDACSVVSSRRGVSLPQDAIETALSDGRAAFFFDGLDEVGYIDKRVMLVDQINALVTRFAARGNRFVLASRPAAVQPVDVPEAFTYLHLRGLTENEISILAGRVLTARVGSEDGAVLTADEQDLVDRLLEDISSKPGIARIARNPLLLTLLVLIYANTGAVSARRHIIYTQAIKTLVSVRGRDTREQRISEADLRVRLGALALAIFRREIAEFPRRSEVVTLLAPLMGRSALGRDARSAPGTADAFIQEVAEATGLLSIHSNGMSQADDLVTFMHYSFLEYYAAAGLLAGDYLQGVPQLAGNPRWRDVMTLMFGMLSEQGDVTELLERILKDDSAWEAITRYKLTLSLECATECDVPPEASQAVLAKSIYDAVASGAALHSADLRSEIGKRIGSFIEGRKSGSFVEEICRGLEHSEWKIAAAFADLLARIPEDILVPTSIVAAFAKCTNHDHPVTRAAAMYAVEVRPELRGEAAKKMLIASARGSVLEKHALIKVVAAVPLYGDLLFSQLRHMLDDPNPLISSGAAKCLLVQVLSNREIAGRETLVERILGKVHQGDGADSELYLRGVSMDREVLKGLVFSPDPRESELAIRNITFAGTDGQFSYDLLMRKMRTADQPRHVAACLDALRDSEGAIDLITIADTDFICKQLSSANRDIRLAAIRLLGDMPDDEQVVRSLENHLTRAADAGSRQEETTECAQALEKHVKRNQRLRDEVLRSVVQMIPQRAEDGFGDDTRQRHILALLSVCEGIGAAEDDKTAWRLHGLASDYRTPMEIRRRALRVFGRLVAPSARAVDAMIVMVRGNDARLNDAAYAAASALTAQCQRKVDFMRQVYDKLPQLRDELCAAWRRDVRLSPQSISPSGLRDIRRAVLDIGNLMLAYEEFSGRAKLAS